MTDSSPRQAKLTYVEQLKHPNWQRKRLEVFQAANFTCARCDCTEQTLHVHHKRYVKGRMAWEYELTELLALCWECHQQAHEEMEAITHLLSKLPMDGPYSQMAAGALIAGWAAKLLPDDVVAPFDCHTHEVIYGMLSLCISAANPSMYDLLDILEAISAHPDLGAAIVKFAELVKSKNA